MAQRLNPCGDSPPKPPPAERSLRRALGCPLCDLEPGTPMHLSLPLSQPIAATLVAVSPVGITVDVDGTYTFVAWSSGVVVGWTPVRYTDRGGHPQ